MSETCQCGELTCDACYTNQSPKFVENVFISWEKQFRDNQQKLESMTPEELEAYDVAQTRLEKRHQLVRDHDRAKRRLKEAIREIRSTRRRMVEEGL